MGDNYIERRMEDLRSGKIAAELRRQAAAAAKAAAKKKSSPSTSSEEIKGD